MVTINTEIKLFIYKYFWVKSIILNVVEDKK